MKKPVYILLYVSMLLPGIAVAQTSTENYVMTETMLNANGTNSMKAVQYYNGLGYPTVGVATTGDDGQTAYTLTTYDGEGREECTYLPVARDLSLAYKTSSTIISDSRSFYANDNTAYNRNHYDGLDRVLSTELPGQAWRSADKRNTTTYEANQSADKVKCYTVSSTGTTLTLQSQNYPAGELSKETGKDADGKTTVTFKDQQGRVILQRTAGNQDTYYVYDDIGHLRFVLPPAFQSSDNNPQKAIFRYEYRYDGRGRVTTKILPGAEYISYGYDAADRTFCIQDAMMRKAGKYRFILYDPLGRVAIQGLCTSYTPLNSSQLAMAIYEKSQAGFLGTGYTVSGILSSALENPTLEVVNYYDDYDFVTKNRNSRFSELSVSTSVDQTGQLTGTTMLTGNGEWVSQVMAYDLRGNLVASKSRELKRGTTDRIVTRSNTYSFTNNPQTSTSTVGVGYGGNLTLTETYAYNSKNDKKQSHTLYVAHGNAAVSASTHYAYNALGQLQTITRPLSGSGLKTVGYTYDLHGWLTSITTGSFCEELFYTNGPGTAYYNGNISSIRWKDNSQSAKRGYKFSYDTANRLTSGAYGEGDALGSNTGRYSESMSYDANGNITSLTRYGKGTLMDNLTISYTGNQPTSVSESASDNNTSGSFEYKKANGSGYIFNANGALVADKSRGIAYITYDLNNNPKQIYFTNGSVTKYVYSASGQKLRAVHYTAKPNITRTWGEKPAELTVAQILLADSTDYLMGGSLTMKNGRIDKYLFEGGYAQASVASSTTENFAFYYYNKDHLGNIREVVDASGAVKQVTNYYPFGAPYAESTAADFQPYKYNGKELDKMHGLNTYDYGARQHDPILGRWDRIDPLCENNPEITPYHYCNSNPINNVDPDGNDYWSTNDINEIRNFLNALGSGQTQYDFSNWQHASDAEFVGNLTYNDETNKFYTSYSRVENGEIVVVGKSFDAHLLPVTKTGEGYPGAFVYQPLEGFWQIANHFYKGTQYNDGFTNWSVNLSGRIIGVAPIIGIVNVNTPAQKSKAVTTLLSKGAKLCKGFGREHGEKVYKLGKYFYSFDNTSHNGGVFKVFKQEGGKLKRIGTADENLNIFKK